MAVERPVASQMHIQDEIMDDANANNYDLICTRPNYLVVFVTC